MASNMIGNLAVNLKLETAAFERGAKAAEGRASKLQSKMAGIGNSLKGIGVGLAAGFGAGAIAGFTAVAASAFEMGSSLKEASQNVGVTVEALQELRFAASQTGVSSENLNVALIRISKAIGELELGKKGAVDAFKAIGLSVDDLKGKAPEVAIGIIADALNKLPNEQQRIALGSAIMGRGFAQLLPLIKEGSAGLNQFAEESRRNGQLTTEQAAKLDDLADGWEKLKQKVTVATASFIANLASSKNASQGLEQMGNSVGGLLEELGKLFGMLNKVELAFRKFGRLVDERRRDSALTSWIPGMQESAQRDINANNARIQQLESNGGGRRGVRGGTGRAPRASGAGAALPGLMAGVGAGALETLDALEAKAANVEARVAAPVKKAIDKIKTAFDALKDEAVPLMDRLFPEIKALVDYKADQNTLAQWAKAGKISADQLTESLIRLRDSYYGVDGPVAVTQDGGFIENITDSLPELADVGKTTAQKLQAQNVVIVKSFKDMADDTLQSISSLANGIKGGGIVGILSGVVGLLTQLGSIGVFGKNLQTSINAPGRARGGAMTSNRSYLVGENGPEIMTMGGRPGYMTPNNKLGDASGRGGTVRIIPSAYFDAVVDQRASSIAAPMAGRAAMAGSQIAQQSISKRQRNRIP